MAKFPWGAIVSFAVLLALVFVLFQIGGVGLDLAGSEDLNESNETIVVNYNNPVHVGVAFDRYTRGFEDDEVITNSSDDELVEGTDYTWDTENGSVTFINTANTTDQEQVNISYIYEYNIEQVRQSEGIIQILIERVPLWLWIPFILFIFALFVWAWLIIKSAFESPTMGGGGR